MKKIILLSAAGLLTTASIVYATVKVDKKPVPVKKEMKKEKHCSGAYRSHCARYYSGAM